MAAASRALRISSAALAAMALTSKGKADGVDIDGETTSRWRDVGAWRLAARIISRGASRRFLVRRWQKPSWRVAAYRACAAYRGIAASNIVPFAWRGAYRAGLRTYVMARLYCVFSRGASFGQPRDKRSRLRVAPGAKAAL
jgi:hypothetical protein